MHNVLVRVCPDRETKEKPIQRIMRIEGPLPKEGSEIRIPALGRPLRVFEILRLKPVGAERAVWCIGTPHDIVFLCGIEPEWEQVLCMHC